ncbi:MAG: hypothetical protein FJ118_17430 [Deltaproteobacteria bacterium]|nr:hypothetical protein [Deltaproteobacteria bacterium]
MTYFPLVEEIQIAEAQQRFRDLLIEGAQMYPECKVGFQGETVLADLFWHADVGFWATFNVLPNRYWNAFGLPRPALTANHDINCEINFPYVGRNLRIAGMFLRDHPEGDRTYVAHTGNVNITGGGGGKKRFMAYNRFECRNEGLIDIHWPTGKPTNAILISSLEDEDFRTKVGRFILKIEEFKKYMKRKRPQKTKKLRL